MWAVIWHSLKDKRWSLLTFCLSAVGLLWMYVAFYPSVQASQATVSEFVKTLPEGLTKAFGLDPRSFTTFEGFLAGKHFSMVWPIMVLSMVAGFAASSIAQEVENGTIELALAEPISRFKIYLSKLTAGVIASTLFVIVSVLAIVPLANAYHIDFSSKSFVVLALVGLLMAYAFLGVAMLFSAMTSDKGRALFLTVGLFLAMYILNIVSLIKPSIENLKYFSMFHYFNYDGLLLDQKIDPYSIIVFLGIFVLTSGMGMIWFNKRDILT